MKSVNEYIQVFDQKLPPEICNLILHEYKETDEWRPGTVGENSYNTEVRQCDSILISSKEVIEKNLQVRSKIDEYLYIAITQSLKNFLQVHSAKHTNISMDSGYSLLRYTTNQFIAEHVDASRRSPRELSCSITLNNDFEGGEFCFFGGSEIYSLKQGDLIMFPSNFMFPHEVKPVTSGVRYSVITWLS